ncbi:unnamed protein product [Acanthosepion pharaonis]|uniref:Transmembrane protein n=1 Tax=Acanthosepion pharaonis TaxID=158019 RepID=A0A812EQQ5_ACAPH|nr:unnamed protein product [Sepia pharaonis]
MLSENGSALSSPFSNSLNLFPATQTRRGVFALKQQGFLPIHFKANAGKRLAAFRCRRKQSSKRFIAAPCILIAGITVSLLFNLQRFHVLVQISPTRRTSARQQLKTPNTVNVTHAEQATAEEHIITPVTDDHIASTSNSALHSSAYRDDDQPDSSAKAAKTPRRGNLSRRSKKASPAKRKREQDSIECASLGEKRLASTSNTDLHSSECRGDDRPGSVSKRAKIPWRGNLNRRSKRTSAAKRKREEETEVEVHLRLSSQSQRRQYILSHETLGERNNRLYCKSVR